MSRSLHPASLAPVLAVFVAVALSACASKPREPDGDRRPAASQEDLLREADRMYREARARLEAADYDSAILQYGMLRSRFPFSDYASQAQAELVWALYRNFRHEDAITEADRFLRDHPRHPLVPYVHYVRGLVFYDRGRGFLYALPFVDPTRRDATDARRAFDEFSLLVQRYPDSDYAADARARMVHLRNQIAEHEMHVVRYYFRRGAYLAAARRAQQIIADYPGAPATWEALLLSEQCWRELGLQQQAEETRALIEANRQRVSQALGRPAPMREPARWYKPWTWFGRRGDGLELREPGPPPPA